MNGSDLLEAEELVSEPVTNEPAMWRNWWRYRVDGTWRCEVCGEERGVRAGALARNHCFLYPSKDAAEAAAPRHTYSSRRYIGAFPVGERP